MGSRCLFEFDRPNPVFYSGETINGRVILNTKINKSVNAVYILFEGGAKVRWAEEKALKHFKSYYGIETYLNTRTQVLDKAELPAGIHNYTFSISIPLKCPSSCVGKYGKISYELSLVLNRSWRFNNVFKKPLTVLQPYDLNMYPDMLKPLKCEDINYFCCWPCSSGPIIATLIIPFGGYAPGQRIDYNLIIDNQSRGKDLNGIQISLVQVYEFKSTTPEYHTKTHTNILSHKFQHERVQRLSKRSINSSLVIPSVPPTSNQNPIIKVFYVIKMAIKTGGCHTDSQIECPIAIGTIPLAQSAQNATHVGKLISIAEPPSYIEATHIGERFIDMDVDEYNRTDYFTPLYPMYTNFTVPSAPPIAAPDVPFLSLPQNPSSHRTN